MRKKAMTPPWTFTFTVPSIIVSLVFLGLAIIILFQLMSTTINMSSKSVNTDATLYAMLNSNDCTPNTKLPFKDVLAIGIAEGKKMREDTIVLNYGGAEDSITVGPPYIGTGPGCIATLRGRMLPGVPSAFYVSAPTCPSLNGCFYDEFRPDGMANVPLSTESAAYIVLPNGDVAKAVLRMP